MRLALSWLAFVFFSPTDIADPHRYENEIGKKASQVTIEF